MAEQIIEGRVIQKIATVAEWSASTLPLKKGEFAIVSDSTGKPINIRVGNGTLPFSGLVDMFDNIQQNVNFIAVSSNALPTPTIDTGYTFVSEGSYTFGGSPAFTVPAGHWGTANWDSNSWTFTDLGELPQEDISGKTDRGGFTGTSEQINTKVDNALTNTPDRTDITLNTSIVTQLPNSRVTNGVLNNGGSSGWEVYKVAVSVGDKIDFYGKTAAGNTSPSAPFNVGFQFNSSDVYIGTANGGILSTTTEPATVNRTVRSTAIQNGFIYINARPDVVNKIYKVAADQPFVYKSEAGTLFPTKAQYDANNVATQQQIANTNSNVSAIQVNFGYSLLVRALSNFNVTLATVFGNTNITNNSIPLNQSIQGVLTANYIGRFTLYGFRTASDFEVIYDSGTGKDFNAGYSFNFTIDSTKNFVYLGYRTWQQPVTITSFDINKYGVLPSALPPDPPLEVVNDLKGKIFGLYGNSIAAINNRITGVDYPAPITLDNTKWGTIVGAYYKFGNLYSRGIGSQRYAWTTGGGSVAFIYPNGGLQSRNDSFNYDNYTGTIPAGTEKIRGAFCSWLRITKQFPESIKDNINVILLMGATNDAVDATDQVWVPSSTVDPEWAASSQYSTFNGDFNITTLKGGMASTIMKMQAWMPQAIIIAVTPLPGRGTTGQIVTNLVTNETTKSIYVRDVARLMSLPVIDLNANSGINGLNRTTYITDEVHPYNQAGNKMLARTIIGGLKGIMPNI